MQHDRFVEVRQLALWLGVDTHQIQVLPGHLHQTIQVPAMGRSSTRTVGEEQRESVSPGGDTVLATVRVGQRGIILMSCQESVADDPCCRGFIKPTKRKAGSNLSPYMEGADWAVVRQLLSPLMEGADWAVVR